MHEVCHKVALKQRVCIYLLFGKGNPMIDAILALDFIGEKSKRQTISLELNVCLPTVFRIMKQITVV